ncbi:hypothetical protein [Helicobacter rodentium]|uniref:hypothetical protein n=1 Tax=Helicobacter rodentium TaxID=59617 RepID=UPI002355174E|nr:hypothetical protein [Helicobacter rodentium]
MQDYRLLRHSLRSFLAMTKIVKLQICLIMDCRDSVSAESRNDINHIPSKPQKPIKKQKLPKFQKFLTFCCYFIDF